MQLNDVLASPMTAEVLHDSVMRHMEDLARRRGYSMADKARYLSQRHPGEVERIVRSADEALKGMLVLPGTGGKPHFVGDPPDWHTVHFHDEEYLWSLNRMGHWQPLLAAFRITGRRPYARKVVQELEHWIDTCPRPSLDTDKAHENYGPTVTPWRSLEVGIRMFETWPWVLECLADQPDLLTPGLLAKFAVSLHEHGEVLEQICPIIWPHADHNHYLMENLGLLALACYMPQLRNADRWKAHAVRELERCAAAQLMSGGGQIEGCPSYHNSCMYWFLLALVLAGEHGLTFSEDYRQRMYKSLEYSVHAVRPNGTTVPWGDSDADYRAATAATYGYIALGDPRYLQMVSRLIGAEQTMQLALEHIWRIRDFDAMAAAIEPGSSATELAPVFWATQLRQVALRTKWTSDALSVFFACRTPVNNGHAHIDPMGFDFTALGRPLLVDPGRFTYREGADRRRFKSPEYHNTITIDRRWPFEYVNRWEFGPQKEGTITAVFQGRGTLAAEAVQHNYEPAVHRRLVAIVDRQWLLVLDRIAGLRPDSNVQVYYHIDAPQAVWDAAAHRATARAGDVDLVLHVSANLDGRIEDGLVSDHMDCTRPSKRLCLEQATGAAERCYAAVVVPSRVGARPARVQDLRAEFAAGGVMCSLRLDDREQAFFWADGTFERR